MSIHWDITMRLARTVPSQHGFLERSLIRGRCNVGHSCGFVAKVCLISYQPPSPFFADSSFRSWVRQDSFELDYYRRDQTAKIRSSGLLLLLLSKKGRTRYSKS